ncbi:MAG: xanthine dehydrogenase [Alphaproteobacteria bacterium]|nr:xanthine dehydrogenase [Alphaproteobacteria bacterium]
MRRQVLDAILLARAATRALALVTNVVDGAQALVSLDEVSGDLPLSTETLATVRRALIEDNSGRLSDSLFVQCFSPPLRMVLVGAVHIAQALAPMASLTGFVVTIVDPRGTFATSGRFPGVALDQRWPDEALAALAPDRRTAVVTLTHDPKLDDPALVAALRTDCFYIGSLGSKRTHATRRERLLAAGFDERAFARIHGPIGLSIDAESPAEIAVAILAEIIKVRHAPASALQGVA